MYFEGNCREIDRVVVSDPFFGEGLGGRYVRHGINGVDWKVQGFVGNMQKNIGGRVVSGKRFMLVLQGPDEKLDLRQDGAVSIPFGAVMKRHDIVCFGGCLGFGVDDNADEILECGDSIDQGLCLNVVGAGQVGSVLEGCRDGEVCFLVISGCLGDFAGYSQQDIVDYLVEAFRVELGLCFSLDEKLIKAIHKCVEEKKTQRSEQGSKNSELGTKKRDSELGTRD